MNVRNCDPVWEDNIENRARNALVNIVDIFGTSYFGGEEKKVPLPACLQQAVDDLKAILAHCEKEKKLREVKK